MQVQHILKSKPEGGIITIAPGTTVADAAAILSQKRIGSLVVSADGETVTGIISERDIVRELGRRGPACMSDKVDDLMTKEVIGCRMDQDAQSVLQQMSDGRFRHMPVMDGDKMVGLISIGDVVKARLSELTMEKDALQDMIMGR
ncbi:CBS domain-containing protein [Actibacterium sp. XHP0104]|uniref:CBS domain-containing protein n=1 Tax=Actibacterium sp. XHP0104 TaxID=2984335 RepID=UPI0021E84711|nr:CBS domain-containing protein [Actibacterium sp. XHP0104]MCV2880842.1 CBS domain-containing protein [Actibacterium sp. XHP0104]